MTNTTLPEAAQLFSQGETLREGEAAPTTYLDSGSISTRGYANEQSRDAHRELSTAFHKSVTN
jgi:hypothetical protein